MTISTTLGRPELIKAIIYSIDGQAVLHTFAVARFQLLDEMMPLTCVKLDGELIFDVHEKT